MKNIVVAGHIDHGKTTLISALSNVFKSKRINYSENPMQISRTETKITFSGESYLFFDYPGDTDYKNNLNGSEDAAILVIAATDGPMPGTKKAIQLCKELGIKKIIVFLNNCDMVDDEELVDLIEYDSIDLLEEYGFSNCHFIRGSAYYGGMCSEKWIKPIRNLVEIIAKEI